MFLVDSHCHLNLIQRELQCDGVGEIIHRAEQNGVGYFLNVSVLLADFPALLETALIYPNVSVSVGSHPNEKDESVDKDELLHLASHDKVIAIGETGLDYYRSTGDLSWQRERFKTHIEVALATKKPLIIHMRDAKEDTIAILRESDARKVGGVMHCFSEDLATAELAMELDFYISISGIATFKNAKSLQEVAKHMPLNKMLIETDSPYLAPNPMRGKLNEPGFIRHTAEYIASLRGISLDELADQTSTNFFNLFKNAVRPHV